MKLRVFKVRGSSMLPTLKQDDYVFCWRWLDTRFKVGDVVVARHPTFNIIIKRIAEIDEAKGVLLQGDNPNSTPKAQLGWLAENLLVGRVVHQV